MRIESIILSLLLHVCVVVLVLFWPGDPPVDLQRQSYQVSLVMGAPGGEELPSPVLGPRPENAPTPQPDRRAPARSPAGGGSRTSGRTGNAAGTRPATRSSGSGGDPGSPSRRRACAAGTGKTGNARPKRT